MVETLPSSAEGVGSIPGQEKKKIPGQGAGIPRASRPRGQGVEQR